MKLPDPETVESGGIQLPSSSSSSTTATTSTTPSIALKKQLTLVGIINDHDDPDRALWWLLHGNLDARYMFRELPHTSDDLQHGVIDREELWDKLKRVINSTMTYTKDTNGQVVPGGRSDPTPIEGLAYHLAIQVLPTTWCRNDDQKEWLEKKARMEFAQDIYQECDVIEQELLDIGLYDLMRVFALCPYDLMRWTEIASQAVRKACNKWASRIDKEIFKGRDGTFLFFFERSDSATSMEAGTDCIRDFLQPLEYDEDRGKHTDFYHSQMKLWYRKNQLHSAIDIVAKGAPMTFKSCWECN